MLDNKKRSGGVSAAKIIAYGAAVFLLAVFQSSVASRFQVFGVTPAYLLALTAAAAFFDGENTGAAVGLASGFCSDALGGVGISLLPIFYTLLGWFIGRGVKKFGHEHSSSIGERLLRWAIWLLAAVGIGMIITTVCLLLSAGKIHLLSVFVRLAIPEAIGTFLLGYPIGVIFMLLYIKKDRSN